MFALDISKVINMVCEVFVWLSHTHERARAEYISLVKGSISATIAYLMETGSGVLEVTINY